MIGGSVLLDLRSLLMELNAAEEVPGVPNLKIYVVALMQWWAEKADPSRHTLQVTPGNSDFCPV